MMGIGAIPETGVVTNGRISQHGGTALDVERERNPWTRTMMRVSIADGKVERYPEGEDATLNVTHIGRLNILNPTQREACRLVIDEGLSLPEASLAVGKAKSYAYGAILRAVQYKIVEHDGSDGYQWAQTPIATEIKTYKIEEGDHGMEAVRERILQLIVDEGLTQAAVAREVHLAPSSVNRHLTEALRVGLIKRTDHGRYEWVGKAKEDAPPEALRKQAPASAGLTAFQVQEMVQQAVAPITQRLTSQLEELGKRADQLAEAVTDLRTQAKQQADVIDNLRLRFGELLVSVDALEADVRDIAGQAAPKGITLGPVSIHGDVDPEAMEQAVLALVRGARRRSA